MKHDMPQFSLLLTIILMTAISVCASAKATLPSGLQIDHDQSKDSLLPGIAVAKTTIDQELYDLDNRKLLELGRRYSDEDKTDKALNCLSIITSRYGVTGKGSDPQTVVQAYLMLSDIYFSDLNDLANSMTSLMNAASVIKACDGERPAALELGYGRINHIFFSEYGSEDAYKAAVDFNRKALAASYRQNDEQTMYNAAANLITLYCPHGEAEKMKPVMKGLAAHANHDDYRYVYLSSLYELLLLHAEKRFAELDDRINSFAALLRQETVYHSFQLRGYVYLSFLLNERGRANEAIRQLHAAEQRLPEYPNDRVLKSGVYAMLQSIYGETGNKDMSLVYLQKYLDVKEEMVGYNSTVGLEHVKHAFALRDINSHIETIEKNRERMRRTIYLILIVALTASIIAFIIYKKNKKLKEAFAKLYENNLGMIRDYEMHRHQKESLKNEILMLAQRNRELEEKIAGMDMTEKSPDTEESAVAKDRKHPVSQMPEQRSEDIFNKVCDYLDHGGDIFSSDFSIERLAYHIDESSRYISQAISENTSANFRTLLNRYRIRESCRRINDNRDGDAYTIESIANDIGMSRSAFIKAFKQETGLTPSEYIKASKATRC